MMGRILGGVFFFLVTIFLKKEGGVGSSPMAMGADFTRDELLP